MSDKTSIIKEAQKYLAKGQIDKAIAAWETLVKESPGSNTYNALGDLYLKKGDKKNAIDSFHRAASFFKEEGFSLKALGLYKKILNIDPADAEALYALGEINDERGLKTDAVKYYLAAADNLSKTGRKERLLEIYSKIISVSPSNIPFRSKVADIYSKEGLRSEAAKEYFNIAKIYEEKGDIKESMDYYQRALSVQPSNKEAIFGINYLYEKTGNLERAVEQVEEIKNLFPNDTDVYLRCAEIYSKVKRYDEAKESLKRVAEAEPGNIKARELLGEIYLKEGDREKAWIEYLPVIEAMTINREYDDAIRLIESFKDVDPVEVRKRIVSLYRHQGDNLQVAQGLISLGDEYVARAMQEEALQSYKEALSVTPDNERLKDKVIELEKGVSEELVEKGIEEEVIEVGKSEKSIDEFLVEADIYLKYGLFEEARNLLDGLINNEPDNIDIHLKLKYLSIHTGNKEEAVTECLKLYELYENAGDVEKKEHVIKEAFEINPEDPRLVEMAGPVPGLGVSATSQEGLALEDYREEIAEADFYSRQGLIDEAREILERLQKLFPLNEEIRQKLASLSEVIEGEEEIRVEEKEFVLTGSETSGTHDLQEPTLDNDIQAVFNEFKKGLEKEFEEGDYGTHYNLGLAYKELGLVDDAIREFQISRNDPKTLISSSSMLAICYVEKGLYPLAIEILIETLKKMDKKEEFYWAMKYDLAEAYEKNGNLEESNDVYTEVYRWNSKFRDISEKVNQEKAKLAEKGEKDTPKGRKDRISYL